MQFEWDDNKNKINAEKHNIGFIDAKEVFNDQKRKVSHDNRIEYGEERMKIIGKIYGITISVIFTIRNSVIRMISARKASQKEREEYNNQ